VSSLRFRQLEDADVADAGISRDPSGLNGFRVQNRAAYRLPRDPATDATTPRGLVTVGLGGNPHEPVTLGGQVDTTRRGFTDAGRPGLFRTPVFRPQERSLDVIQGTTVAPGTIRRNVRYNANGARGQGFFSWAANAIGEALGFVPARPPQDEYIVSSLHLMLPDSLATVVSGTTKSAPGLEPFRERATIQAQASSGWPVEAPQIPSYGSRVPLRRPRGLVSVGSG
jgi:hypothetical protein